MAVEFAGIVNGRGSEFTLVYRGPQILRCGDDDVRNTLAGEMVKKGIKVVVETTIDRIEKRGEALHLHLSDGSVIEADAAMRRPAGSPTSRTWASSRSAWRPTRPAPGASPNTNRTHVGEGTSVSVRVELGGGRLMKKT